MKYLILAICLLLTGIAYAQIGATSITIAPASTSNVPNVLVAGLPACNAGNLGAIYFVTNALAPVIGSAPVGGGAVSLLVHCNGTIFIVA